MRIIVITFFVLLLTGCKKNPKATVETVNETPVITVPVIDSVKSPIVGLEIGNIAPELNLPDTNNVLLKTFSLRGKLVLIDFWASWCKPCRVENKKLMPIYEKYKDLMFKNGNGFEVYCVNIDQNKKIWKSYLEIDKLNFKHNVFDSTSFENRAANLYQIKSIPLNFLIDNNGIIVAKNLRDTMVEVTLKRYLK